jgi:hypothetical protein
MPNIKFNVSVYLENAGVLPELGARLNDLSPAFQEMFLEWTKLNMQKFEQSVGKEEGGAEVFEEFWAGLTPEYMAEKHGEGKSRVTKKLSRGKASFQNAFPDWIMVRTGALREAMTNPDMLFSAINDQMATFGTPNDPELADIVQWQSGARQKNRFVLFLSGPDVNMIKRVLQDYLGMGGDFQAIRSEKAMAAIGRAKAEAEMNAEFEFDAGGE